VEFYLGHGFFVLRDDPGFPLVRRDLVNITHIRR